MNNTTDFKDPQAFKNFFYFQKVKHHIIINRGLQVLVKLYFLAVNLMLLVRKPFLPAVFADKVTMF